MATQYDYQVGPFTDVAPVWGDRLWSFLNEAKRVTQMTNVSDAGRPAVEAVAFELYDRFGEDVRQDRVKQFVGFLTRQVMERNGYRHVRYGRKVKENPVFSTASQYAPRDD